MNMTQEELDQLALEIEIKMEEFGEYIFAHDKEATCLSLLGMLLATIICSIFF